MSLRYLISRQCCSPQSQTKKFLSLLKNDGWEKLESLPKSEAGGEPNSFYDYTYFLREFEKAVSQPLQGKTTGEVPKWLVGSLLQNGPGKYTFGNSSAKHWFDGSAVIQKFTVKEGKVSYECQLLNTETLRRNTKANKHVVSEFATRAQPDPCHTIFQRLQAKFTPFVTDNCAVSIYPIDGDLYALTETPKIHRLDVEKTNSSGMVDLSKKFTIMSQSAHPHVFRDGNVYNVGSTKGEKGPAYGIYEIPYNHGKGLEKARLVAKVPCTWPWKLGYMHSFGITDTHYILIEQPLTLSLQSLFVRAFLEGGLTDVFKWKQLPVNFYAVHRNSGEIKTFTSDTFFYFHTINQYEEDNHIVMDVCTYDNAAVIKSFMIDAMKGKNWSEIFDKIVSGKALRFVLPLDTEGSGNLVKLKSSSASAHKGEGGVVHLKPEVLCEEFCELPRFNQDYLAKNYKYFYGINFNKNISATGKVLKVDVEKKETVCEWYEEGTSPSEPIFVPSPQPKSEDDGVLILSVLSAKKQDLVTLVLLDAKNLKEISRTEFNTPGPIPKSIHGWFS